ncbi:FAD-dependent oxidoreductase [Thiospirochaeta perfilievii]|uniref:FAD-dependent oxidoreductase n=1 Tax=Thiospirochaeta perfilievii TaxID=252967 RepID=A0A5C1QG64_9SPIO|nr:FAD-dependent oxidoreductase [Thiospirochaeta perfilievii]QEN05202.1 FAD-dependent oxidoreductase [Thiospirochaeta perfilievii]
MGKVYDVGIIGGGISGSVTALQLANSGVDTILLEQKDSLVNGPPFCHLHAGGNLYPDISDDQCKLLMKQSIEMSRLFPQSIDKRPTLITVPKTEKLEPDQIERRLKMLVQHYKKLIEEEKDNSVLGEAKDYYKIYYRDELDSLKEKPKVDNPQSVDDWMVNAIKVIDYHKLKMPIFMVQEYGWNMFRLAAQAQLALESAEYCELKTNTTVTLIEDVRNKYLDYNWKLHTKNSVYKVKYLVNSSGYKTGSIDKSLKLNPKRLIEFKAAYVSKWDNSHGMLPEIIFHGERGTPNGMAQLTPYYGNYFQIHGMTDEITLFKGGLVRRTTNDGVPDFNDDILKKLNDGWEQNEVNSRTERAINFIARFIPLFKDASVAGPPLFGAQQIVGTDSRLRVGEVSFPEKFYARSEIIKASSALTVARKIVNNVQRNNNSTLVAKESYKNSLINSIKKVDIERNSKTIALRRGFPEEMANLLVK